jgi:hypothetical protein
LNERIGSGVEISEAGFRNGVPDVLSLAVGRTLQQTAVENGVTGFGDVSPRLGLFRGSADTV